MSAKPTSAARGHVACYLADFIGSEPALRHAVMKHSEGQNLLMAYEHAKASPAPAITPEEWARRLRLLLQAEEEAALRVAEWALFLADAGMTSSVGSEWALKSFKAARDARLTFIAEIKFP